ncbi:MAG: DUF47 domain-containing protein [Rhodoblastus sp.]
MLGWFHKLMPREDNFFDMYTRHMATVTAGAAELRGLLRGEGDFAEHAAEIGRQERMADEIMRELLLAVRRTFITPFDRSDISGLGTALDDSIDQIQRTAKKMALFDVRTFEPKMVEMGEVIVEASEIIDRMVGMLPEMRANNARISALNVQMAKLEEKADELHDQGVKALYLAHRTSDPMAYVVGSEVYDHLEKVVDRLEDIGNRIVDIVIEHM